MSRFSANPEGVTERLCAKHVLIAGAGGLGSNAAMMLVRAGIGELTLVDFDVVSESNLNRQFYFADQIGQFKVEALRDNLKRIHEHVRLNLLKVRLTPENYASVIPAKGVDLVLECFDSPRAKAEITAFLLAERPELPFVAVSGIGGVGPVEDIRIIPGPGAMTLVGDRISDAQTCGTLSSRVMTAAAVQVHTAVKILFAPSCAFLPPPESLN